MSDATARKKKQEVRASHPHATRTPHFTVPATYPRHCLHTSAVCRTHKKLTAAALKLIVVRAQMMEEKQRREKEREEFKKAQELESLRRAFKRIDKSGDGHIDCDELLQEVRRAVRAPAHSSAPAHGAARPPAERSSSSSATRCGRRRRR